MNWLSKNYMQLRFQKRVDALKKAGIPVTQQTVYDETLDVGVPVPSAEKGRGQHQSESGVNPFVFAIQAVISSFAAFFSWLVTPSGPTVFEDANREYYRKGGVREKLTKALSLLVVGMVGAVWAGYYTYMGLSSSSWPTTTGVVCSSEIQTYEGSSGKSGHRTKVHAAKVTYTYVVGNRKFTSDRVCYGDYGSSGGGRAAQVRQRYPVGATILVHYHPSNPTMAVLETGATWFILLFVSVGTLFTLCGIVVLIRTINAKRIYLAN